jgi:hypothetical protein
MRTRRQASFDVERMGRSSLPSKLRVAYTCRKFRHNGPNRKKLINFEVLGNVCTLRERLSRPNCLGVARIGEPG